MLRLVFWLVLFSGPVSAQAPVFLDSRGLPVTGGLPDAQGYSLRSQAFRALAPPVEEIERERDQVDRATWIWRQNHRRTRQLWKANQERFERLHPGTTAPWILVR